jgi:hypothetical protein
MVLRRLKRMGWLALLLALAHAGAAQAEPDVGGIWRGTIGTVEPLEFEVRLERLDEAWSGTIAIPAEAAVALPLEDVTVRDDEVRFAVAGLRGSATFHGDLMNGRIEGTFAHQGEELPFELLRSDEAATAAPIEAPAPNEPEPEAPAPDELEREGMPGAEPADPEAPEPADEETFDDSEGRFSVPVPAGWTVREYADHVVLSDPDAAIRIAMVIVEEEDLEAAIEEAWSRAEPRFDQPVDERIEPTADPGVEAVLVIHYQSEPGLIWQAIARLHDGTAHVFLVAAELEAAQRRDAEIGAILTGYRILGLDDADGSGTTRRVSVILEEFEAFVRGGSLRRGGSMQHRGGHALRLSAESAPSNGADLGVVLVDARGADALDDAVRAHLFDLVFGRAPLSPEPAVVVDRSDATLEALRVRILERAEAEAVERFLGRYYNEALGEVRLRFEDERLLFDAGQFRAELRPVVDADGTIQGYLLLDGPVALTTVALLERDGEPIIEFGEGLMAYTFTRIG